MLAHDGLDSIRGFVCVVEGDGADVMMKNVRFNDAMEELSADESEFAINGGGGASGVSPCCRGVVR